MIDFLKKLLADMKIDLISPIPLSKCRIVRPYKLTRCGFDDHTKLTAIMIAVPYLVKHEKRNISAYASPKDYHLFFKELFGKVIPLLEEKYQDFRFCGFADDSPINERDAAASAGLGIIGENMMLITEKYSSYIFLGEIITDMPIASAKAYPIKKCDGCGKCRRACPMDKIGVCLSALTQKKGELSDGEKKAILDHNSAWGCDICQEVCPHTLKAIEEGTIYTEIDFFKNDLTPYLTSKILSEMSDEEFSSRAYSWRGRMTINRNLLLFEKK